MGNTQQHRMVSALTEIVHIDETFRHLAELARQAGLIAALDEDEIQALIASGAPS